MNSSMELENKRIISVRKLKGMVSIVQHTRIAVIFRNRCEELKGIHE